VNNIAYKIAQVWAEAQDLRERGVRVTLTCRFEVNQIPPGSSLEPWEIEFPKELGEFLEKALEYYKLQAGLEIEALQRALEEARERIARRNLQIKQLRARLAEKL
jgi:hypothetical protein